MTDYRARRATIDDLPQLMELWRAAQLPAPELEKQFTDFQVVEDGAGKLLGALGMRIEGPDGKMHSETFADFALVDTLRPLLWQRLHGVAQNHGLVRVWTEETAPFWKKDAGFTDASEQTLQNLPEVFGQRQGHWQMLQLRSEVALPMSVDKEFARFKEEGKLEREKMMRTAQTLRTIATIIAALLFIAVFGGAVYYFVHKGGQPAQIKQPLE